VPVLGGHEHRSVSVCRRLLFNRFEEEERGARKV
jgi:hypothetical protein